MDASHPAADSALGDSKSFSCGHLAAKKTDQVTENFIHGLNAE